MPEPITPISISSEGGIKPITNRTPETFRKKLGTLVEIGAADHDGRTIYVKHPSELYQLDGEEIKQFSLYGKQSIEQTGIKSGQAHMLLFKNKDPYYQSALMQIPNDRGELPWKTIGAVSFIDSKGEKVTIPRDELTLRKPKSPSEQKDASASQILGPSRDAALHEDYGEEDIVKPVQPDNTNQEPRQILVGMADGRQDNLEGIGDGVVLPTPPEPLKPIIEPNETPQRHNVLSVVGSKSKEVMSTDLAKTALEGTRDIIKKFFAAPFFEEKFKQYYDKMLDAAQTSFARESIQLAEKKAKTRYDAEMKSRNALQRGARKTWDWIKDHTFGTTTIEQYAIDEISTMTDSVLERERITFQNQQQELRKRFELPFDDADKVIRKNLGETLLILDKPEYKPLADGIKGIVKEYITPKSDGTYMTDAEHQDRLDQFYNDMIYKTTTPEGKQMFADSETYASSLTLVAKEMRDRLQNGEGLASLNAEVDLMEVRLGHGVMGPATEITPTETKKWVARIKKTSEWLEKKGVINNIILNDATVGTAVSAVLALKLLPQAALSSTARMWLGAAGGGAVAGTFSGMREYKRRHMELRRIVAQKEAGIKTPDTAKQRQMYEAFDFKSRTVNELVDGMQKSIYTADGTLKDTLTSDELQTSLANLADTYARKTLSSQDKDRFGLIVIGAIGEQETNRTRLDATALKTEKDLTAYLESHRTDAVVKEIMGETGTYGTAGSEAKTYIEALTSAQTSILQEGNDILNNLADPYIKLALSPLSSYTPEVDKLRYTLGIFGKAENRKSKGTGSGLDEVLKDFNKQATAESARMGLKTAGIGIGVGALVNEAVMDIKYGWGSGALSGLFTHPDIQPAVAMAGVHAETIGGRTITLGNNMDIDAQGNLDVMDAAGHIHHDVVTNFASHIQTDQTGMHLDNTALDALHRAGLNPALTAHEVTTQSIQHTAVASSPTELPGALHVADASGVDHTAMWSIPNGTHLVPGADSHTFALADTQGKVLIADIHTNDNGAITNFEQIKNNLPDGWTIKDIPQQFTTEGAAAIDNSTRTINVYTDLHEGGIWQWAQEHTTGTPVENQNAALNVIKNVWKSYQNVIAHDSNITFDKTIPGYENIPRSVPHLPNGDIWPNAIPDNSVIELPNALFSDHNMVHLAQWSDQAVRMYDAELLTNPGWDPMTALEHIQGENPLMGLVLRIGRFGMMSQERLSADELNMLMHALAATEAPTNVVTDLHSIVFTETLSNTVPNTTIETVLTAIPQFAGPEGFIPIIPIELRKGLEPIGKPRSRNAPDGLSGFYGSGFNGWLTPERRLYYENRLSERLTQDPNTKLEASVEIPDYFKRQSPEYLAQLEQYMQQEGMKTPMDEECDAMICVPVYTLGEGKVIQNALEQYYMQIDSAHNKQAIDPKKFEVDIFLNHPKPQREKIEQQIGYNILDGAEERVRQGNPEAYDTEEVIKQFQQSHPELRIRVMKQEFNERPRWSSIIRPLYDMALLRSTRRTDPFRRDPTIITNDIDVIKMSPTYMRDILQTMDQNELAAWRDPNVQKIDGGVGMTDMAKEGYKNAPGFLAVKRLYDFLELQRGINNNHSTQGRNTFLRGSTLAAIGGVNDQMDDGADGELGLMVYVARKRSNSLPFLHKAWLETDPRREFDSWKKGKPLVYNWSDWAAMSVYGNTWKDRFNGINQDPTNIRKEDLAREINEIALVWGGGQFSTGLIRSMDFLGLRNHQAVIDRALWRGDHVGSSTMGKRLNTLNLIPSDYHIENDRIIIDKAVGHQDYHFEQQTDDKGTAHTIIVIDDLSNVQKNLQEYITREGWKVTERKIANAVNQPPIGHVANKFGIEYTNYEEFDGINAEIFTSQDYPWTPNLAANPKPKVIDLGGHIGMSVAYWKDKAPDAQITVVEANPHTSEILKRNIARNKFSDVNVIDGAATDKTGTVDLYEPKPGVDFRWGDFVGGRPVDESKYDKVQVPAVKLSELITRPVDVLKVDIEGSELAVMKEAESKLSNVHELFMEFHNDPTNPENSYDEMMALLQRQGFTIQSIKSKGQPFNSDTFDRSQKVFINIHANRSS
jgi:FkbM family methyltransferase